MSLQSSHHRLLGSGKRLEASALSALARFVLRPVFSKIELGSLLVTLPTGEQICGGGVRPAPKGVVAIHNWRILWRLLFSGDVGVAQSYADGDWSSPDLTAALELGAVNGEKFMCALEGSAPTLLFGWLAHRLHANSRAGSRRNIAFHYDLGNEFYRSWLDERMIYSSALFRSGVESLEAAQAEKLDRIVELVDARAGCKVLEIGCGWGALAMQLAQEGGARVTALTLSSRQQSYAKKLASESAFGERVDFRLQDYRDVAGTFDRIVSVEMIEAVGRDYWPMFFSTLRRRLAPSGHAVLQAITIADDRFESYSRNPDFIQRCIFPGGALPSQERMAREAGLAGLSFEPIENFGESYARTLSEWRRRFQENRDKIEALGFDARFCRLWEYYLCYCEAGFRSRVIDVGLYRLKPTAERCRNGGSAHGGEGREWRR